MRKHRSEKAKIWLESLAGIFIFLALAYLSGLYFLRIDLTEEKRHTLTATTIEMLEDLDDVVYIKVFLEGDFPADYQRLSQSVREKLDEMRAYAGDLIQYEFLNPSEAPDQKSREDMYGELVKKGLEYSALQIREPDGISEKIVFPGALVSYGDREIPLQILQNQQRATDAEMVNRTITNLEYAFVNALYQVQRQEKPKLAFIEGHGELKQMQVKDLENELSKFYITERLEIGGMVNALSRNTAGVGKRENRFDAIVIAKPKDAFSEMDKYLIDQFIMNGGKVLWLLDAMDVNLDSLRTADLTMSIPVNTNLDDLLFTYGIRLNKDLLIDRTCAPIQLLTGPKGNERTELFPWYFQPILLSESPHPIVANVDPILTSFISSIDTVEALGIKKTTLLRTSQYTRILNSPVRVSFNIVSINPDFGNFNRPHQPVAKLLEGEFTSNYKNRLPPEFLNQSLFDFKEKSEKTRMIVVADGDIAQNNVSPDGTKFRPLGFDPLTGRKLYGNREFLVNAMNYLLGDASLINVRSRSIKLRKLDQEKILRERYKWQAANVGIPVLITLFFGALQYGIRRRRYTRG